MKDYKDLIIKNLETLRQRDFVNNDKWKVRAYDKVIKELKNKSTPIYSIEDVKDVKGVGEKIKLKITEIIETGELQQVESIKDDAINVMNATTELSEVFGIGPIKAKELYEKHHIKSVNELKEHLELLNDKQKIGVKYYEDFKQRIPRKEMMKHEEYLKAVLTSIDKDIKFVIMGSYRRGLPNSGDIDILLTHETEEGSKVLDKVVNSLQKEKYLAETLGLGNKKYTGICRLKRHRTYRRLDMLFAKGNEYSFALLYFTGSANFNVKMRNIALSKGFSLSEYGLKYIEGDKKGEFVEREFVDEKSVFDFLEMDFISPENRK